MPTGELHCKVHSTKVTRGVATKRLVVAVDPMYRESILKQFL